MGILTTAVGQLTGELFKFGFGQLDDFVTRKIQEGRDEEAFAAVDQWEKQAMQTITGGQGLQGQGGGGVLGGAIGDFGMPALPPEVGQSPEASKYFFPRFQQMIKQDPNIVGLEQQQDLQKEILSQAGKKASQNLIGLNEIGPVSQDPSLLPRDRILQNLGERQFTSTTGGETAKEPFRQKRFQERLSLKQSPSYKQLQGGGGGAGGGFNVPQDFLNRTEKELSRDKSGVYLSTPEAQESMFTPEQIAQNPALAVVDIMKGGDKAKPQLTDRGLRVMQIAEELAAGTKNRQPLSIINEAKAREKKEFNAQQKAASAGKTQRIQEQQSRDRSTGRLGISSPVIDMETPVAPARPTAPAPQERAAEVQTGQNPTGQLTAQDRKDIAVMKKPVDQGGLGMTDDEVNAVLRKAGKIK